MPHKGVGTEPQRAYVALFIYLGVTKKYYHFLCEPCHEKACTLFKAWSSKSNMKSETLTGMWRWWWEWFGYAHHTNFCLLLSLPHQLSQITKRRRQIWPYNRIQIIRHPIRLSPVLYTITLNPGKSSMYLTFIESVFFKNSSYVLLLWSQCWPMFSLDFPGSQ